MCGIIGAVRTSSTSNAATLAIVRDMAGALAHRGPDDQGIWADETSGVFLGHRRLSIVDLSSAASQPMESLTQRYVAAFNGEIYNHSLLRQSLERNGTWGWRGHSDTETLLAAFDAWGIERTLQSTRGMFALALWDRREKRLHLIRDRVGEKPLYYGWIAQDFVFASELGALKLWPGFAPVISRKAMRYYSQLKYVPAPLSIFEGISKLEPGCMVSLDLKRTPIKKPNIDVEHKRWWSLADVVEAGKGREICDENEVCDLVHKTLNEAVGLQSASEVACGAFLSGGVDSATIAALMQTHSNRPINTFTVGFEVPGYDESSNSRAIASYIGTQHHELIVTPGVLKSNIDRIASVYDEPFADSSQIPVTLLSSFSRRYIKVALSGDGGDELFCGYNRYIWVPKIWAAMSKLPIPIRRVILKGIIRTPEPLFHLLNSPLIGSMLGQRLAGEKMRKLALTMSDVSDIEDFAWKVLTEGQTADYTTSDLNYYRASNVLASDKTSDVLRNFTERLMFCDIQQYLPGDILCKLDRASMASGLEARVPMLDPEVLSLSWRIPVNIKHRNGVTKWPLRQVLSKYVPKQLIAGPKAGFGVPLSDWLRGPLKQWASQRIQDSRYAHSEYFDITRIRQLWKEHLEGSSNNAPYLWSVLMFMSWCESN